MVSASPGALAATASRTALSATSSLAAYYVYWDQNEQEDVLSMPSGRITQLIPPWDANGQMCVFPDGSGRFVTGYNPTTDPTNPGYTKPVMQPPVGEAVWNSDGSFSGQTLYVPGRYKLPGQTVGGDIPPDSDGQYNNNGTMTGCVFDPAGNLFASDLGTAQGQFPSPDDGRLIEWFAPSYTTYCIVDGPSRGGVGPHHVDGTAGLTQPGELASSREGDILVPQAGPAAAPFNGRVVRYDAAALPKSAAQCPDGLYPKDKLKKWTFIQGNPNLLPFSQSVVFDQHCRCWAAASIIGDPAIAWFTRQGKQDVSMGTVPGETITQVGQPNGYNPFGIAVAPGGVVYFADIHIVCTAPLTNCGPASNGGRIMRVTFTDDGKPNRPVPVASGYNFPTSVTVCVPARQLCPLPAA
jgi:hypothetical protein